jgi:hypothetical protein
MADTEGKSKEELYIEARDILALISSPGDSPTTTALRSLSFNLFYIRNCHAGSGS